MTKNMATVDRILRFLFAAMVAILYFTGLITGTLAIILGIVAAVFLLTSLVGFCPLYALFKFSTLKGS